MPVYNAAKYLGECLESILSQTYSNWELITVDDFSNDESWAILGTYVKQDQRIKRFKNTKKGITPALLKGYQHMTGEFITRMDADDIMTELKLQVLLECLGDNPDSIAIGKVKYFADEKSLGLGYLRYANWLNSMTDNLDHFHHIYEECVFPSSCWMMSRTTFDSIGGFEAAFYPEDYDLSFRIYQHKLKIKATKEIIHLWRDHPSRASRNDDNYQDQRFIPLKLHYFLRLDYDNSKKLMLWGCGSEGKLMATYLIKNKQAFEWITGNPKKIGQQIYGIIVESTNCLKKIRNYQIISGIKTKNFHLEEKETFQVLKMNGNEIYHFH